MITIIIIVIMITIIIIVIIVIIIVIIIMIMFMIMIITIIIAIIINIVFISVAQAFSLWAHDQLNDFDQYLPPYFQHYRKESQCQPQYLRPIWGNRQQA